MILELLQPQRRIWKFYDILQRETNKKKTQDTLIVTGHFDAKEEKKNDKKKGGEDIDGNFHHRNKKRGKGFKTLRRDIEGNHDEIANDVKKSQTWR